MSGGRVVLWHLFNLGVILWVIWWMQLEDLREIAVNFEITHLLGT